MAKLIITANNGRHRREHEFQITDVQAKDPIERAALISAKSAQFDRVVNWRIED